MLPVFKGLPRELRITMHLIWGSLRTYASASVLEQRNEAICLTTAKAFPPVGVNSRLLGPGPWNTRPFPLAYLGPTFYGLLDSFAKRYLGIPRLVNRLVKRDCKFMLLGSAFECFQRTLNSIN